jgi:hypothetical protein
LGIGMLTVFTLQGQAVAKSNFDGRNWSANLTGLTQPVYMFQFQSREGEKFKGKILGNPGL